VKGGPEQSCTVGEKGITEREIGGAEKTRGRTVWGGRRLGFAFICGDVALGSDEGGGKGGGKKGGGALGTK